MEEKPKYTTIDDLTKEKREKKYIYQNWLSNDDIWKCLFSKEAENNEQFEQLDPWKYGFLRDLVGGDCCNIMKIKSDNDISYYLCISRNSGKTVRIQRICFCKQDEDSIYTVTEQENPRFMLLRQFKNKEGTKRWTTIGFEKPRYDDYGENQEADMECFRNASEAMEAFAEITKEIKEEKLKNKSSDIDR